MSKTYATVFDLTRQMGTGIGVALINGTTPVLVRRVYDLKKKNMYEAVRTTHRRRDEVLKLGVQTPKGEIEVDMTMVQQAATRNRARELAHKYRRPAARKSRHGAGARKGFRKQAA